MALLAPCHRRAEAGAALLVVLVLLVAFSSGAAAFIWFMNQQQTRAGAHFRAAAAAAVAEAGVHRTLAILESVDPDEAGPGRRWRPAAYSERMTVGSLQGRFTVSVTDGPGDAIIVTSTGEVAGVTRRLRARVYLTSPALLTALYGEGIVRFESPPAAAFLLPYGAGIGDRPWIHVAAGREIWFATSAVSINNPEASLDVASGPVDAPEGANSATALPRPGPVRLLLPSGAELTLGNDHARVEVEQLRREGVYVEGVVLRPGALPRVPQVDRAFYQAQAAANEANADLNHAVGKYHADVEFLKKRDSLYSRAQFDKIQAALKAGGASPRFRGMVYIQGGVVLRETERIEIEDGVLVTDSTIHISQGASLQVRHTAATRTLPGIIVLDNGGITVTQGARLRVHGLIYASRLVDVGRGAHVDIVGAVLANDPGLSFRNLAATVTIRYDPAVMGTPGLRMSADAQVVAWVAAWEELP